MYMVMFVLDNPALLDDVLDAWREAGVSGVTITESSGLYRQQRQRPVGARYAFGMPRAAKRMESGNVTLFTIVPDAGTVQVCLRAAEAIIGDLSEPDTGVLAAWPLDVVKGVPPELRRGTEDAGSDASESEG